VMTGTVVLNYAPPLLAILALVFYYLQAIKNKHIQFPMLAITVFMAVFALYACFNSISLTQSAIGFYIWLPFFTGMLLQAEKQENILFKWIFFLWGVAVIGVILNSFVNFPWTGTSSEVLG